jgi:hypothetical protein
MMAAMSTRAMRRYDEDEVIFLVSLVALFCALKSMLIAEDEVTLTEGQFQECL